MPHPLVSAVVVNHNGIEFVDACLRSISGSDYPNLEVIFVDNASRDGSLEYVKKNFGRDDRLKFIENKVSLGPAVGRNRGVEVSRGVYLIFFDNDTCLLSNCISELVKVLEGDPSIGAGQAKLLQMNTNRYDCAGDYLGPLGFLIERAQGAEDKGQFDFIADILSAKSAASIIRADLFRRIGGFDEDFYMYLEETDLSWRVWLAGYRVVFIPNAVTYHAFNTCKKDFRKYYSKYVVRYNGCRNYITTLVKNLTLRSLCRIIPAHIACLLVLSFFFILEGNFKDGWYILKAIGWNIINATALFKKRKMINVKVRKVSDNYILNKVMSRRGIFYYLGKADAYLRGKPF